MSPVSFARRGLQCVHGDGRNNREEEEEEAKKKVKRISKKKEKKSDNLREKLFSCLVCVTEKKRKVLFLDLICYSHYPFPCIK